MAITWGSTTLAVQIGSWKPYQTKAAMVENKLLPDPADIDAVCSVLQQMGRERYRVKASLMFAAMSEYTTLLADKNSGTGRTLADGDTINGTYYIESLTPPTQPVSGHITTEITFVEG